MRDVLIALYVLAVIAVLFVAAVAVTREDAVLADAPPDAADIGLPEGVLQPEDIAEVHFGLAFRGYRMSEVDEVLMRLGEELTERDSRIAQLEQALVDLVEPELARAEAELDSVPIPAVMPLLVEDVWTKGAADEVPQDAPEDAPEDAPDEAPEPWLDTTAVAAPEEAPHVSETVEPYLPVLEEVFVPLAPAQDDDDFPEVLPPEPAGDGLPEAKDADQALEAAHAIEADQPIEADQAPYRLLEVTEPDQLGWESAAPPAAPVEPFAWPEPDSVPALEPDLEPEPVPEVEPWPQPEPLREAAEGTERPADQEPGDTPATDRPETDRT